MWYLCVRKEVNKTNYVSVNSNWVHPPGQPQGIPSKQLSRGSEFGFWKLPGGREFDKGRDFVEVLNAI